MMKVLVTGGLGFIGSHTCVSLMESGYEVVIADDLSNSSADVQERIAKIAGKTPAFYKADVTDQAAMERLFSAEKPEAIIHFAGFKSVPESVENPLKYYANNVGSTLVLCALMKRFGTRFIIFSSSATVYGDNEIPYREDMEPCRATNPYGRTKAMSEEIIRDFAASEGDRHKAVLLRYFNPVGAHESGLLGEDPRGVPGNLMPYIQRVAAGKLPCLTVYGTDYPTVDGTGVRDYIHVMDLAQAHVAALRKLEAEQSAADIGRGDSENTLTYNIGTGRGTSVLEMIQAFERATGVHIEYKAGPRRAGDLPEYYACADLAEKELGWKAKRSVEDMCRDAWNWQKNIK